MKLEKVQKKVLSSSRTNVHVGSGWKPYGNSKVNVLFEYLNLTEPNLTPIIGL